MTNSNQPSCKHTQKPVWLRRRLPSGPDYESVRTLLKDNRLHTVCQEARCPNQWECFSDRTATFLIMGPSCTRNCRFCAVDHGPVHPLDLLEPLRVAETALQLGLTHVVITSVTRDDLFDGGAYHFAKAIQAVRKLLPEAGIEVLIPDFQGNPEALENRSGCKARCLEPQYGNRTEAVPIGKAGGRLFAFPAADSTGSSNRAADTNQVRVTAGNGRGAR